MYHGVLGVSMTNSSPHATTRHGILAILAAVMPVMAIVSLVPVKPLLEQEFSSVAGSAFLVPAALTIPALCLALFSPAAGWLADRIGRKTLLVVSLLLYGCIGILPFFLNDLKQIIASRFALGITEAAIMTVATTLIGDYFKGPARERWLGIQVAAASVSAVLLVMIGGVLGQALGSRGPFLLYLAAIPLALVCFFVLFEPSKESEVQTQKLPLPWARLLPLTLGGFVLGILFYVVTVKLGNILALKTEVNPSFIGQMSGIINAAMILGAVSFGLLKSRLSAQALIACAGLIIATGYAVAATASSVVFTMVGCTLVIYGSGILLPTFLTWVMSILTAEVRGRGTGLWQGAFFLGQFIAPIVAVGIAQPLGGLQNALLVFAVMAFALMLTGAVSLKGKAPLSRLGTVTG
jgi:MFS family permease